MKKFFMMIFVMMCIVVMICFFMFFPEFQFNTYEFSPKTSLAFFGVKPESFFDVYYDYYDSCEDFRNHAQINEKGNLVLRLTKKQEEVFLQYYDSQLDDFKQVQGVNISNDYTLISIKGNREEVAEIIANKMSFYTVFDLANRQLIINKTDPDKIVVEVKVIDENTGNCVYNAVWPQEAINFSVKDWQFVE